MSHKQDFFLLNISTSANTEFKQQLNEQEFYSTDCQPKSIFFVQIQLKSDHI